MGLYGEKEMKIQYMIGIIIGVILIGSAITFFSLNQPKVSDENPNDNDSDIISDINLSSEMQFHESANNFGFKLLQQFIANPMYHENPFFSPYSIFTALAMAYEGAAGNTAVEMAAVLNIQQDNESFHNYVLDLYNNLNNNTEYNMSTANAAWIEQDFTILDQYIRIVENFYQAESTNIDFSNPEQAATIINQWVENNTNNLIRDLVTADAIDPALTRLILTNAIYFKGAWEVQFDKENTTDRPFTTSLGETIDVPTMSLVGTQDTFYYTENQDFQMIELPYTGNDLSMIIILPKETRSLSTFINSITEEDYAEWLDTMEKEEVDLYLPKFTITTPLYSIGDMLSNLGIHDAFTYNADFSGITGTKDLLIQYVFHKAFIEVNEEGTEAAAATAVVMNLLSINGGNHSRIVFDCDHPFIYLIQQMETGTILFMGAMGNPTV